MVNKSAKDSARGKKDARPRIIIKKVKGHGGGHHGGAWKVAYADFVTAMMALFLILWVLGSSNSSQRSVIAHYFREPGVFSGSTGIIPDGGMDKLGAGIIQQPSFEVLRAQLSERLGASKELAEIVDQVPIEITKDGLLIEIIDKNKRAFFDLSSPAIKPTLRKVLELIVHEIKDAGYPITISGHTDARAYRGQSIYSNWDLSAARALNTRQLLQELGVSPARFAQVVGYADRQLRVPDDPLSAENRRISILLLKSRPEQAQKAASNP